MRSKLLGGILVTFAVLGGYLVGYEAGWFFGTLRAETDEMIRVVRRAELRRDFGEPSRRCGKRGKAA